MDDLKQDIKDLHSKVDRITEMSVKNTASLEQHMMRTELNEKRIEKMEYYILGLLGSGILAILSHMLK